MRAGLVRSLRPVEPSKEAPKKASPQKMPLRPGQHITIVTDQDLAIELIFVQILLSPKHVYQCYRATEQDLGNPVKLTEIPLKGAQIKVLDKFTQLPGMCTIL